jgi:hypothetical protein
MSKDVEWNRCGISEGSIRNSDWRNWVKAQKTCQNSQWPGRDQNRERPKYKSEAASIEPTCSRWRAIYCRGTIPALTGLTRRIHKESHYSEQGFGSDRVECLTIRVGVAVTLYNGNSAGARGFLATCSMSQGECCNSTFNPLKTEFRLHNIYKFSPYLTGNILRLRFKAQPVSAVKGNNRCLLWEQHGTHKYTLCAECRVSVC